MKTPVLLLALLSLLRAAAPAAPLPVNGTMTYSQNFDTLGTVNVPWVDDSLLPGWYAQMNSGTTLSGTLQATDGAADLNGLLNCGISGSTDRALGSKATSGGSSANISFGVSFHNAGTSRVKLTALHYTGELWRPNATAGSIEHFAVYYQISNAPVTNLVSGPNSSLPVAGTGYTAMGAGADWAFSSTSAAVPVDGNAPANRRAVTFLPVAIVLNPGEYLMIKWTDPNENATTDGFQALDDVSVEFTEVTGYVDAAVSNITRNSSGTPDPLDDTFGFSAKITGNGVVGPGWTTADVNPPAGNTAAGAYGTTVVWTGFPVSGPKNVTILDTAIPSMDATVTVTPPAVLGVNELGMPGALIAGDGSVLTGWVLDETAMTATLESQAAQTDHVINSSAIDLSSVGFVLFTGDLDTISGASSGFEAADFFSLDLIIDGAAPVSALGSSNDVNLDGKLSGAAAGAGTELQDTGAAGITKSFHFAYLIPAAANSLQIRITGNNNSTSEKYLVKNLKLSTAPALLFAQQAAPIVVLDNKGTVSPLDDEFSAQVAIQAANLGASTGWHSDETPARTGLYAAVNPVAFGPYLQSAGARTVKLIDNLNPLIVSQPLTFLPPPAPTLTVSAPVNIQRHENGPGAEDDTVSFDVSISGTRGGPGWSSAATTPSGGTFGANPVTLTFQVPSTGTTMPVTITDASYPATNQTVTVAFPGRYIFGRLDLGGGLLSLASDLAATPPALWVNNATARTLTMSAGTTVDSVVTSELIDLSNTGEVQFSAKMHLKETSAGSNIENGDRFKAELIIDGAVQNLITAWDTGDGSSAVTVGANGPPNGYINGYQGAAGTDPVTQEIYANAGADYFANKSRDEFNVLGQPVTDLIENDFPLSFTIPAAANSVQLKIYGAGFAGSEVVTVSDVLFSTGTGSGDSDGDGISDANEAIMGTDPNNAADVLRLSVNVANPAQIEFTGKAGKFYRVYVSDDTDGQEDSHLLKWKDAGLATLAGNGGGMQFNVTVLSAEKRRFYRLHVMGTDGPWPAGTP